jgi:hypothetical protein
MIGISFREQAQYVHAHNAIPTDINEVYISTWLQQKKEFLKPLEMLYVKREREKLLARQNTFAQMSPNTLSCFLQTQPRKSLCTPKTTRGTLKEKLINLFPYYCVFQIFCYRIYFSSTNKFIPSFN